MQDHSQTQPSTDAWYFRMPTAWQRIYSQICHGVSLETAMAFSKSTGQHPNLSVQKTKVWMTKVLLASSSRSKPSRQLRWPAGGGGGGCRGRGGRQGSKQLLKRKMHIIRINDDVCFETGFKSNNPPNGHRVFQRASPFKKWEFSSCPIIPGNRDI